MKADLRTTAYAMHDLVSIGPGTAFLLRQAGIVDVAQLRQLGTVRTFRLLRQLNPKLGLQVLWRLESALSDTPIVRIAAARRAEILLEIGGRPPAPPRRVDGQSFRSKGRHPSGGEASIGRPEPSAR